MHNRPVHRGGVLRIDPLTFGGASTATSTTDGRHASAICGSTKVGGIPPRPIAVPTGESFMRKNWLRMGLVALVATVFVSGSNGEEASFKLPAMGDCAVSPDNSTLVVSLI